MPGIAEINRTWTFPGVTDSILIVINIEYEGLRFTIEKTERDKIYYTEPVKEVTVHYYKNIKNPVHGIEITTDIAHSKPELKWTIPEIESHKGTNAYNKVIQVASTEAHRSFSELIRDMKRWPREDCIDVYQSLIESITEFMVLLEPKE